MSATSGHNLLVSGSYAEARQIKLQETLRRYGVLSRRALFEFAGAHAWHIEFSIALAKAIEAGRIKQLGDDLFEATHPMAT